MTRDQCRGLNLYKVIFGNVTSVYSWHSYLVLNCGSILHAVTSAAVAALSTLSYDVGYGGLIKPRAKILQYTRTGRSSAENYIRN